MIEPPPPPPGSAPVPGPAGTGLRWRQVTAADVPALREVCLRTGDAGGDATARTRYPDLLGDVYAAPYAVREARFGTVVEDDEGVAGYLLGCRDTAAFEHWREAGWWPALRLRYPRPQDAGEGFDSAALRVVHAGVRPEPVWTTHPSHLHVDLLPRVQGRGLGRLLLQRVRAQLAADGSPGLHLGVSAANAGALRFYRRNGLVELARSEHGYTLGCPLSGESPSGGTSPGT